MTAFPARRADAGHDDDDDDDDDDASGHRDAEVIQLRSRDRPVRPGPHDDGLAQLAALLRAPQGAGAPDLPEVAPIVHSGIRDRTLVDVLDDALDHLAIRWE